MAVVGVTRPALFEVVVGKDRTPLVRDTHGNMSGVTYVLVFGDAAVCVVAAAFTEAVCPVGIVGRRVVLVVDFVAVDARRSDTKTQTNSKHNSTKPTHHIYEAMPHWFLLSEDQRCC